jgi:glycosyltransferase involved in cell wall biosynthesis
LKIYEKYVVVLFPIIFFNPFFWKELMTFPSSFFQVKKIRKIIAVSIFSSVISNYLKKKYLPELKKKNTILYSFWFYYASYGAALLKRKGFVFKLFTRAHGSDIFQNRKDTAYYIPFRRFPIWKYFEKILPVSKKGANYLEGNQRIPRNKISVSYLGVSIPKVVCKPSVGNSIAVVSCSNIISLKRIQLIIKGIAYYKTNHPDVQLSWTHIGEGLLMEEISALAKLHLKPLNIEFSMLGQLSNTEVLRFYNTNSVDCFVSTSSSEGLPVTIMEALSFGIPVMATSVGGVVEAVNETVGVVLDKNFLLKDFDKGLIRMFDFKDHNRRKSIKLVANEKFNAGDNYSRFINNMLVHVERKY